MKQNYYLGVAVAVVGVVGCCCYDLDSTKMNRKYFVKLVVEDGEGYW